MNKIVKESSMGEKNEYRIENTQEGWVCLFDGGVYEAINADYNERLGVLLNEKDLEWEMDCSSSFTVYKH